MNSSIRLIVTVGTLSLAVLPLARAVDEKPPRGERREGGRAGPGERGDPEMRLNRMAEHLDLTADQRQKIGTIMKAEMEKGRALMEDESIPREQKREKHLEARKAARAEIRALLTPEQQQRFDALPERGSGGPGGFGGREGGPRKPKA